MWNFRLVISVCCGSSEQSIVYVCYKWILRCKWRHASCVTAAASEVHHLLITIPSVLHAAVRRQTTHTVISVWLGNTWFSTRCDQCCVLFGSVAFHAYSNSTFMALIWLTSFVQSADTVQSVEVFHVTSASCLRHYRRHCRRVRPLNALQPGDVHVVVCRAIKVICWRLRRYEAFLWHVVLMSSHRALLLFVSYMSF